MTKDEERARQRGYNKKYFSTEKGKVRRKLNNIKYYGQTECFSAGKRRRWSPDDVSALINFEGTDPELAFELGRTIKAVERKRGRLRMEGVI